MAYGPVVVKPTGRGRVMLRSPMALAKPRVLCNFLTTRTTARACAPACGSRWRWRASRRCGR